MSRRRLLVILAIAAILLLVVARSANTEDVQSAVKATLHFFRAVTLSGKELQPGTYSLVDADEAQRREVLHAGSGTLSSRLLGEAHFHREDELGSFKKLFGICLKT